MEAVISSSSLAREELNTIQTESQLQAQDIFKKKEKRFRVQETGGTFAETTYLGSSFKVAPPKHLSRVEQVEEGRPLWLTELNKKTPAGAAYAINSSFGSNQVLLRTRATAFKNQIKVLNATTAQEIRFS